MAWKKSQKNIRWQKLGRPMKENYDGFSLLFIDVLVNWEHLGRNSTVKWSHLNNNKTWTSGFREHLSFICGYKIYQKWMNIFAFSLRTHKSQAAWSMKIDWLSWILQFSFILWERYFPYPFLFNAFRFSVPKKEL